MDAGTLDKRIKFKGLVDVLTEYGTTEQETKVFLSCWARIEPARGREYWEAQKERTEKSYKITTRYHKGITPSMTILYGSREFEIQNIVDPYENHSSLEIYCAEKDRGEGAAT